MPSKAKESKHIKRARIKLRKIIEEEHNRINERAIQQARRSIRHWIDRHMEERIDLRDKTIRLFDENKHPAQIKSQFVRERLKIMHPEPDDKTT